MRLYQAMELIDVDHKLEVRKLMVGGQGKYLRAGL